MLLIPIIHISIAVVGARAYPLGNPLRPIVHNPGDSLSCSSMRNLDSLPVSDSMAHSHMYALVGDTQLSKITSRELATSIATTLLGGGLALIFT